MWFDDWFDSNNNNFPAVIATVPCLVVHFRFTICNLPRTEATFNTESIKTSCSKANYVVAIPFEEAFQVPWVWLEVQKAETHDETLETELIRLFRPTTSQKKKVNLWSCSLSLWKTWVHNNKINISIALRCFYHFPFNSDISLHSIMTFFYSILTIFPSTITAGLKTAFLISKGTYYKCTCNRKYTCTYTEWVTILCQLKRISLLVI